MNQQPTKKASQKKKKEENENFIQALADDQVTQNKKPTSDSLLNAYELFHGKANFPF